MDHVVEPGLRNLPVLHRLFQRLAKVAVVAGLIAVVFNAGANYVLIFGKFGLPALGVVGSGLATTLSQTAMLLILVASVLESVVLF